MKFTSGLPETKCGLGSTLRMTEDIRAVLPELLRRCGTKVLLDAPCGDCNWISRVHLDGIKYVGVDESGELLARACQNLCWVDHLQRLDLTKDPLPRADTVLCRDFLQHLPDTYVENVLKNLTTTGASWFLMTSHSSDKNADINVIGGFRPLDLTKAPYDLGQPAFSAEDPRGSGRILGAWPRQALDDWWNRT